jgi:outer membrane protein
MPYLFRFFLISLLLPLSALAQKPLSLGQAIAIGLRNNYDLRIAELEQRQAAANNAWGNAGALPRLDLNLNGRYFRSQNPASFFVGNQNISPGLSLSWTVFDGFAMFANKQRFELLEAESAGNAAVVVENTIQAIVLAYYNALLQQQELKVRKEILSTSQRRLEYEEFRREVGSTSTFDLLQFKTAVITDSAAVVTQRLALRNTIRSLNLLMQEPIQTRYVLTDTLETRFESYQLGDLQEKMLGNNHNLQNQYLRQQVRRQETRSAQAAYWPSLSLGANANLTKGTTLFANRDTLNPEAGPTLAPVDWASDYAFSFTLSFTIFDGFNRQRQMQLAQLNEAIAATSSRQLEQSLTNELSVVYDNYEAQRQILGLQSESARYARRNLDLANDRFESGLINTFDFRQVQLQYLDTELERLRVLRDLNASETDLVRLVGGLVREEDS